MDTSEWRRWLRRGLTALAICTVIATVSVLLQAVLAATGDLEGATAVRGVLLVAVTGAGLSLTALVVILAIIELHRDRPPE